MPQQLLTKIDRIISLAEEGSIPTTKFSTLFELLSRAHQYSCSATQDKFSLSEASAAALDNCDAAFKRFLLSRLAEEEDRAKEELESCEHFAGGLPHAHSPSTD